MDTAAMLQERKTTHGNYDDNARCAIRLHAVVGEEVAARIDRGQDPLTCPQEHALGMILHKIARIVTGKAGFKDHWDDIAGYAKLVADRCGVPPVAGERNSHPQCRDEPINGADILFATGCADDCTHPSHRHGRPGRRADEQGEDRRACACAVPNVYCEKAQVGKITGYEAEKRFCQKEQMESPYKVERLTPAAKPPCSCLEGCVIDRGGVPPKHVYCCKAAVAPHQVPRSLDEIRERGV